LKKAKKCTRLITQGALIRKSYTGINSVPFSGRLRDKALTPGAYRAILSPRDAAGTAARSRILTFTIVRG
jgi:hypothetical protein